MSIIGRVQVQGIQVFKLVYLSEEEFEFLKLKRVEFLKRVGYFPPKADQPMADGEKLLEGRKVEKKGRIRKPYPSTSSGR